VLPEAPLAVFAMHPDAKDPVSAVVVSPGADDEQPEVTDLRQQGSNQREPRSS
jgi:hypothetical protein